MASQTQKIAAVLAAALCISSCAERDGEFLLRNGDLLFQVGADSAIGSAIQDATSRGGGLPFTHVAIAEVAADGTVRIIEATGSGGVCRTELADCLARSAQIDGRPAVAVGRVAAGDDELAAAVERAAGFIGQPYDWGYMPDNGRMYCSELVYESFLNSDGEHIFASQPMNFRAEDGSMPRFWEELFDRLGEPVPEGVDGTNPAAMSQQECVEIVGRYYRE